MAEIDDARGLLVFALQDLWDGERANAERLPAISDAAADGALVRLVDEDAERSDRQRRALAALADRLDADPEGGPNIWLAAIHDDAANDGDTLPKGPLRDVALVGALRKAKQAERVSYETALALARALGEEPLVGPLAAIRDEEAAADAALAMLLDGLCAQATSIGP